MTQRHLSGILATGAAVLVAVAACGSSPSAKPPSTSPTQPSVSATPTSPSTAASTEASALVRRYFMVLDQLGQHPGSSLQELNSVTVSSELTAEQRFLASQYQRGEKQVGSTKLRRLTVQSVNLENSNPAAGVVPTVTIDVCWDVTNVDVLGKDGKSIVSPNRPNTGWTRYSVANYHYATDPATGWRVASAQDLGQHSCGVS